MSSNWESGKLTVVYHPVGTRSDGEPVFKRASFDLLRWASTANGPVATYISTIGGPSITAGDINDFSDASRDAWDVGQEFGYYSLGVEIIEQHMMGTMSDNWMGVHRFGYI